jgi:predicted PurR-regulated permease PerM
MNKPTDLTSDQPASPSPSFPSDGHAAASNGIPGAKARHDAFQRRAFLIVLALVSIGFLYMVRHFLVTLLLAAVFSGLAYPVFLFLSGKLRSRIAGALLTLLLMLVLLVLPATGIVMMAYQQAAELWDSGALVHLFQALTTFGNEARNLLPAQLAHLYPSPAELAAAGERSLQFFGAEAGSWIKSAANALVKIALMFMFMFYFLLDGPRMAERVIRWSPLPDNYERALFQRFLVVGRGAFMGIFVIGALQGTLTGLLLWLTGVPSPVFLGVLAVMASIIPAFGAGLIWVPASLYLMITGNIGAGLVVIVVGAAVISTVDNILRPAVVGKNIKMHDLMVLVSTLGGLILFGLPGFLVGPIVAAFFLSAWAIYEEMFGDELDRNKEFGNP